MSAEDAVSPPCDVAVTHLRKAGVQSLRCVEMADDDFVVHSDAPVLLNRVIRLCFELEPPVEFLAEATSSQPTDAGGFVTRARPLALSEEQARQLHELRPPAPRPRRPSIPIEPRSGVFLTVHTTRRRKRTTITGLLASLIGH